MGDGSNSINYHRVGVIRENPLRCIYTADDQGNIFIVSSSEFENRTDLKDGDCCVVDFKTNFSEELGNGVYNAEIYKYDSVAVWPLHETLTDTTVVLDKERLVTLDFKKSIYLEGRLAYFAGDKYPELKKIVQSLFRKLKKYCWKDKQWQIWVFETIGDEATVFIPNRIVSLKKQ